jgi:hypothetical protein
LDFLLSYFKLDTTKETKPNVCKGGKIRRNKKELKKIKQFEAKLSLEREGLREQDIVRQMDVGRQRFVLRMGPYMSQSLRVPQNKTPHVAQIPRRLPHSSFGMYHMNGEWDQLRLLS